MNDVFRRNIKLMERSNQIRYVINFFISPLNSFFLQYKIGQLYMIAKHSAEQSQKGEGVEVVENRPHSDPLRLLRARQF